jgi:hypothetical protein
VRGTPAEILEATGAPDLEEAFVRAADQVDQPGEVA